MDRKFVVRFVAYWMVNTLILSLANSFFPSAFAMGNAFLSIPAAGVFAGFLLTVLLLLARGLGRTKDFPERGRFFMFLYYWGAGSAGIWIIARIAHVTGFGIARFTWAIGCGFVVALASWILRQAFKGMKLVE